VVTAVLLFRIAENKRKRPPADAPDFVRYSSCFASMLMGRYLLKDLAVSVQKLDHRNFDRARQLIAANGETYFNRAIAALDEALNKLYGGQRLTLHRLAATFRRGDLFDYLG
jgi:hypothetical protein